MYYIGVDGGGTKTSFVLYHDKKTIDEVVLTTSHYKQVGYDGTAEILFNGIMALVEKHRLNKNDLVIGIGIAGYGNDEAVRKTLETAISKRLSIYKYYLTSDIHITMIGALDNQEGIVVIAGTGSIALSNYNNNLNRVGGWGYLLGDEGSAFWIGKQLLQHFTQQSDGRQIKTLLYKYIKDKIGIENDYQIIEYINSCDNYRTTVASMAVWVDELAQQNDQICIEIIDDASEYIYKLIKTLAPTQGFYKVSYYGGVFKSKQFINNINNKLQNKLIAPIHTANYGAMIYAINNMTNERVDYLK